MMKSLTQSWRTATNEDIDTFGGGTRDYTSLDTWEDATDIDLVTGTTSKVLECYNDAASWDQDVYLAGATSNADYFRIIRPAAGTGTTGYNNKHNGVITTTHGIHFFSTANASCMSIGESYAQVQGVIVKLTCNSASTFGAFSAYTGTGEAFISCIAYDSTNAGAGVAHGFFWYWVTTGRIINCLAHNNDGDGFYAYQCAASYVYNMTSDGNVGYGYNNSASSTITCTNCIATNNTAGTSTGVTTSTTCTTSANYSDSANNDFRLAGLTSASPDTANLGTGTSLRASAYFAFDDDCVGTPRGDDCWDVGFYQLSFSTYYVLRPTGDHDVAIETATSGLHYAEIDEPAYSDADYVQESRTDVFYKDLYTLTDLPYTNNTDISIYKVIVTVRAKGKLLQTDFIKLEFENSADSTYTYVPSWTGTGSASTRHYEFTTSPFTSAAWTVTEVNGLKAGISLKGGASGTANVYQFYVRVVYSLYLDNTSGVDTNSGISETYPLKTFSSFAALHFNRHSRILLKRGETWKETMTLSADSTLVGGSPGITDIIYVGAYGTGDKPKIDGSESISSGATWTLDTSNTYYSASSSVPVDCTNVTELNGSTLTSLTYRATVDDCRTYAGSFWYDAPNDRIYVHAADNFNLTTAGRSYQYGVRSYGINIGKSKYVTIENIYLRSVTSKLIIGEAEGAYVGQNITITNCDFYYCIGKTTATLACYQGTNKTVTFTYNTIYYVGSIFQLDSDEAANATSCVVSHNTATQVTSVFISLGDDTVIEYNVCNNDSAFGDEGARTTGDNNIIRYNYFRGTTRPIWISGGGGHEIYYNVLDHNYTGADGVVIALSETTTGVEIYNNTIIAGSDSSCIGDLGGDTNNEHTNLIIKNNILKHSAQYAIILRNSSANLTGFASDYNCIYISTGNVCLWKNATKDLAAWQALGFDTHPVITDPLLVGGTFPNSLKITSSSPCKDAGVNLDASITSFPDVDAWGNTVPYNTNWDIGANEYKPVIAKLINLFRRRRP